jgi:predicted transcriptional regulator
MATEEKLVIKPVGRPQKEDADTLVSWFLQAFDLSDEKKGLEPFMLKEIINGSRKGDGVTSKELNSKLEAPRTTVIYHLNRFIYSGLVVRKGRKYYLRSEDMESTLEELQADMMREFQRMMAMAEKLDDILEEDTHGRRKERRRR